jgi:hypothetical protein
VHLKYIQVSIKIQLKTSKKCFENKTRNFIIILNIYKKKKEIDNIQIGSQQKKINNNFMYVWNKRLNTIFQNLQLNN